MIKLTNFCVIDIEIPEQFPTINFYWFLYELYLTTTYNILIASQTNANLRIIRGKEEERTGSKAICISS